MFKNISIIKYLTLIAVLVFLFSPVIVNGFALDLAIMQLEAVSEKTSPVMAAMLLSFIIFAIGFILLISTTSLLQSVIDITPEALTVMHGETGSIIQAGWNFTVGIGNMLVIIAFIIIAISTILGYDNYHFKKLMPKLVIVALLMNFTLLFVGMGIDISNFLFNSIANQFSLDGGNIIWEAMNPLFELTNKMITGIIGLLVTYVLTMLIPYVNVATQVGWIIGLAALIPYMFEYILLGGIMITMSGVFFLYFAFFVARILVIQFLAIAAPLAFFCLIFTETSKYWKKWLTTLSQWLFAGVAFIFLMYIGLALAPLAGKVFTPDAASESSIMGGWLKNYFVYGLISHIILLIYFIVIAKILRGFVPAAVNAAISQGTALLRSATPFIGAIAKGGIKQTQHRLAGDEKLQEKYAKWATENPPTTPGFSGSILKPAWSMAKRKVGGALGPGVLAAERKAIDEHANKMKSLPSELIEGEYINAQNALKNKKGQKIDSTAELRSLAAVLAAKRGNAHLSEETRKDLFGDHYESLMKKASATGFTDELATTLPVHHAQYLASNVANPADKEKAVGSFVAEKLKGNNMTYASPEIVDAIKDGNVIAKMMVQEMIKARDGSVINFAHKAKGTEGAVIIEKQIDVIGQSMANTTGSTYNGTPKERGTVLKQVNPDDSNRLKKSLAGRLFTNTEFQ